MIEGEDMWSKQCNVICSGTGGPGANKGVSVLVGQNR